MRMADRELYFRHVGVLPDSLAFALLALIDQPIVVAFVNDMAFRCVQGGRPDPAVEFPVKLRLLLGDLGGLDVKLVSRLL